MPNNRDSAYLQILTLGLNALRDAARAGDSARCFFEAEHLHNIPSLVGEENISRHLYYFNTERVRYIERAKAHDAEQKSDSCKAVLSLYVSFWEKIIATTEPT